MAYKHLTEAWKKPKENLGDLYKEKIMAWRREPTTVRVERPTRLDRARSLGYKAKQGIFVVRQRVPRGSHTRPHDQAGRRPKTQRRVLILRKNYQQIAEERAARKYPNCEVLNSYWVGEEGEYAWYEIIFVDVNHPRIAADPNYNLQTRRAFRGLTSAARKSRGLRGKGKGFEKARPGRRANKRLL
ncbi:MAG: 50S ribosomal protein L15e [Candidatus Woesearchaeota archaeon]